MAAVRSHRVHRLGSPRSKSRADSRWLREIGRLRSRGEWDDRTLLEGPHLVAEALAAGLPMQRVFVTRAWAGSPAATPILRRLSDPPVEVDDRTLRHLADTDAPQGVLAIARLERGGAEALPLGPAALYLYADGVQDPGNVGALARVAEAAGAAGLILGPGSAHPNHPRSLRASAGSLLRLPVAWRATPAAVDERLGVTPRHWLLLDAHSGEDVFAVRVESLPRPLVVAVGSEGGGLSAQLAARSPRHVRIPLAPPVESLNVVTAAALVLFQIRR